MVKTRLLKAMLYAAMLVLVDRGVDFALTQALTKTELGRKTDPVVKARAVKANVIVLGTSRARRHYDVQVLREVLGTTVFNAGCDGQLLPYVRAAADLILQDYKPSLMIVNVEPSMLVEGRGGYARAAALASYFDESAVVRELLYATGPLARVRYLCRAHRHNQSAVELLANAVFTDRRKVGYEPILRVAPIAELEAQTRDVPTGVLAVDAGLLAVLRELVESVQDAGVQVVLASAPCWRPDHRPDPRYVDIERAIATLAVEAGVEYVAIGQHNAPMFRNPSFFADAKHLNGPGARVFTTLLAHHLKKGSGIFYAPLSATRGEGRRKRFLTPFTSATPRRSLACRAG